MIFIAYSYLWWTYLWDPLIPVFVRHMFSQANEGRIDGLHAPSFARISACDKVGSFLAVRDMFVTALATLACLSSKARLHGVSRWTLGPHGGVKRWVGCWGHGVGCDSVDGTGTVAARGQARHWPGVRLLRHALTRTPYKFNGQFLGGLLSPSCLGPGYWWSPVFAWPQALRVPPHFVKIPAWICAWFKLPPIEHATHLRQNRPL